MSTDSPPTTRDRIRECQREMVEIEVTTIGKVKLQALSERIWQAMQRWLVDATGTARAERRQYDKSLLVALSLRDAYAGGYIYPELIDLTIFNDARVDELTAILEDVITLPEIVLRQMHDVAWRLNIPEPAKN